LTLRSPAQFERILAEVLRITKNLKGEDWVAIEYHTQKRKRQGVDTIVYINDEPQNSKKLARQANRYRNRVSEKGSKFFQEFIDRTISKFCCLSTNIHTARSPLLPSGVVLETPPLSPAAIHGTETAVNAHVVDQNVTTTIYGGGLVMDATLTDIGSGLENLEDVLPLPDTVTNDIVCLSIPVV